MKAVIIKSTGTLEVQDIPEPECKPDEIKVKIAYAGICGTDPKNHRRHCSMAVSSGKYRRTFKKYSNARNEIGT